MDTGDKGRWRLVVVGAGAFTALGLLFAFQRYYAEVSDGRNAVWTNALLVALVVWWSWAAFTPLIVWIARKFPISSGRRWTLAVHLPASVAVVVLHALVVATITPQFYWRPSIAPIRDMFRGRLSSGLAFDMLVYFLICAVIYLMIYAQESRRKEIASAELAATLARTQLHALQLQLQPHFLFNTLNSILALVHEEPAKASLMIRRLSELLRYCLATSEVAEVPLAEEIEVARAYLDIQKIRFEERLEIIFDVGEDALGALVPSFVLQPLIENAVKFSLADDSHVARITVTAGLRADDLDITVSDNGPGIRNGDLEQSPGVGMRATRARLQQLYGARHLINVGPSAGGGTEVSISIPCIST